MKQGEQEEVRAVKWKEVRRKEERSKTVKRNKRGAGMKQQERSRKETKKEQGRS